MRPLKAFQKCHAALQSRTDCFQVYFYIVTLPNLVGTYKYTSATGVRTTEVNLLRLVSYITRVLAYAVNLLKNRPEIICFRSP